jgi:pyruvate formate lyase activating enzyme
MFNFLPNTKAFSFGTVGCNFSCKFCQNFDISQYPKEHEHKIIGKELPPERIVELAIENGCKSIAYTYNEPIVFFEYTYDTAKLAHEKGIWVEITTLLIPGKNDSDEEIRNIAKFIAEVDPMMPWHLSAFYPMYKMLDVHPTPLATLRRTYEIGKEEGLKYIYVGNIDDEDHESTYCPKCGKRVIDREGSIGQYVTNELDENGTCPHCGYKLEGIWH